MEGEDEEITRVRKRSASGEHGRRKIKWHEKGGKIGTRWLRICHRWSGARGWRWKAALPAGR